MQLPAGAWPSQEIAAITCNHSFASPTTFCNVQRGKTCSSCKSTVHTLISAQIFDARMLAVPRTPHDVEALM